MVERIFTAILVVALAFVATFVLFFIYATVKFITEDIHKWRARRKLKKRLKKLGESAKKFGESAKAFNESMTALKVALDSAAAKEATTKKVDESKDI